MEEEIFYLLNRESDGAIKPSLGKVSWCNLNDQHPSTLNDALPGLTLSHLSQITH